MTKEERDALIASARKTPWLDTMKRRETEALLEALDDAEKRVRDIEDLRARIVSAMSCEPDDDSDLVEAVRENVRERDDAERERDAARAQLAALHAAASAVQTRARALPVSMTEIVHAEEWDDLDRVLADLATAAAEHERRVRASVEADRDQLAALHAAAQRFRDAVSDDGLTCRDNGLDSAAAVEEEWEAIDRVLADLAPTAAKHKRRVRAKVIAEVLGLYDGTNGCAAADLTPVIKAAQSLETRIRADERVRALREAADVCRSGITEGTPAGWSHCAERIRAMVDEAERGTR